MVEDRANFKNQVFRCATYVNGIVCQYENYNTERVSESYMVKSYMVKYDCKKNFCYDIVFPYFLKQIPDLNEIYSNIKPGYTVRKITVLYFSINEPFKYIFTIGNGKEKILVHMEHGKLEFDKDLKTFFRYLKKDFSDYYEYYLR